jgi:hypothetical protein
MNIFLPLDLNGCKRKEGGAMAENNREWRAKEELSW